MNFACEKIAYPNPATAWRAVEPLSRQNRLSRPLHINQGSFVDCSRYLAVINDARLAYNETVAEISVAGRRNPLTPRVLWRINNAFFVHGSSMAGDAGQSERVGRVSGSRFPTPASFATLSVGRKAANAQSTRSNPR